MTSKMTFSMTFPPRAYYITDSHKRVRLPQWHKSLTKAQDVCANLNKEHEGRYACGDWCDRKDAIDKVNRPHEWEWDV